MVKLIWLLLAAIMALGFDAQIVRSSENVICAEQTGLPICKTVKRSMAARNQFMRQTGHPHGWKGHVVDHVIPLACGGGDIPGNMQWQTIEEAKAKDRTELKCCMHRPPSRRLPSRKR